MKNLLVSLCVVLFSVSLFAQPLVSQKDLDNLIKSMAKEDSIIKVAESHLKKNSDFAIASKDSSANAKNQQEESFLKEVSYKELKTSINGYSQTIGEVPIDLFFKKNGGDYLFKITEPVIAQTYIAGDFAIFSRLKNEGINTMSRTFTFSKNVGKNVSLIQIIAIKK